MFDLDGVGRYAGYEVFIMEVGMRRAVVRGSMETEGDTREHRGQEKREYGRRHKRPLEDLV